MTYRIFLSSPGDVDPERNAAERVVARINAEHAMDPAFELIRWEHSFYTAAQTFQTQIPRPSACDLVVCVFWKRLGSDLPEQFRREDGTLPTGTEFEFEDALQRATTDANKVPDILVYRKNDRVQFDAETVDLEKAQRDRFLSFWNKWFRNEKGQFVAAFHSFLGTVQFESLFEDHLRQWLGRHSQGVSWTRGSPFRGLESFDVEHAPIYFGRRYDVERARARLMTNALAGTAFLLVTGPSGAGKSSLARAGLIPRLIQPGALSEIAGTAHWITLSPDFLKPEPDRSWGAKLAGMFFADGLLGKALAAGDFDTPDKLARLMERGGGEAAMPLSRALRRLGATGAEPEDPNTSQQHALVVLVDSLEQIFQWDAPAAAGFASFMQALAEAPGMLVTATIRSDYLHRIAEIPPLAQLCATKELRGPGDTDRVLDIGFPSPSDLREMIIGPAKAAGLVYEWERESQSDLGKQLEADADPESLPVLSFLLKELYEKRSGNVLTWQAYREIGGLAGALSMRGEAALSDKELTEAFPYLVRRLIAFGGHPPQAYGVPVAEETLAPEPKLLRLAKALVDAGLLVSAQRQLRLAHDTLLLKWKRLADQVAADRRNLETRERLGQLFQRFKQVESTEPKNASRYYLEGFPLAEGRNLLADWGEIAIEAQSPGMAGFITRSVRRHTARGRRNIGIALLVCSVVSALLISLWWFSRQRSEAELLANIRLHLARVESAMRVADYDRAVGLAMDARALAENEDTRSALLSAMVEQSPHLQAVVNLPAAVALWIDERQFLLIGPNGEATLLTSSGPQPLEAPKDALADAIAGVPDGEGGFVLVQANGGVIHAKPAGGTGFTLDKVPGINLNAHFAHQASFHVKGGVVRLALTDGYSDTILRMCNTQGALACKDTSLGKRGTAVAIAPNGETLALSESGDKAAQLWLYSLGAGDIAASAQPSLPLEADATSLEWSGDGRWLALGRRDGRLQLLDGAAGQATAAWTYVASANPVVSLSWSGAGNALAFNCGLSQICLADEPAKAEIGNVTLMGGSKGSVKDLMWNPQGTGFVSLHGQSELRYWLRQPKDPVVRLLPVTSQASLLTLASDPQRHLLAAGDDHGNVWIIDLQALPVRPQASAAGKQGAVASLAYAADGALAAGYANGQVSIQVPSPAQSRVESLGDSLRRLTWSGNGLAIVAPLTSGDLAVLSRSGAARILKSSGGARADGITSLSSDQVLTSHRDGSLRKWNIVSGEQQTLYDKAEVADQGSALCLTLDGSGRWIAATRLDDQLRIYDVNGTQKPIAVPLRNRDTKVVAFSPANNMLAALGSDGMLYVWQFDQADGSLTPLVSVFPVPSYADKKGNPYGRRAAAWLAWVDDATLAIATSSGDIVMLGVSPPSWQQRLQELGRIGKLEALLD